MLPDDWRVADNVYPPREDSQLLTEVVQEYAEPRMRVLDVCTGSGVQAYIAAEHGATVVAVDRASAAVACARANLPDRVDVREGDLFRPVDGTFDLVICNPPYVPDDQARGDAAAAAWDGGSDGRAVIDRFIAAVPAHLADQGAALLLQSSVNGVEETRRRARRNGLDATVVAEEKVPWERLQVVRLEPAT